MKRYKRRVGIDAGVSCRLTRDTLAEISRIVRRYVERQQIS